MSDAKKRSPEPDHTRPADYFPRPGNLPADQARLTSTETTVQEMVRWWDALKHHPTLPQEVQARQRLLVQEAQEALSPRFPDLCDGGCLAEDLVLQALAGRIGAPERWVAKPSWYEDCSEAAVMRRRAEWHLVLALDPLAAAAASALMRHYPGLYLVTPSLPPGYVDYALEWAIRATWQTGVIAVLRQTSVAKNPVLLEILKVERVPQMRRDTEDGLLWRFGGIGDPPQLDAVLWASDREVGTEDQEGYAILLTLRSGAVLSDAVKALRENWSQYEAAVPQRLRPGKPNQGRHDYLQLVLLYCQWLDWCTQSKSTKKEDFYAQVCAGGTLHAQLDVRHIWENRPESSTVEQRLRKALRWLARVD